MVKVNDRVVVVGSICMMRVVVMLHRSSVYICMYTPYIYIYIYVYYVTMWTFGFTLYTGLIHS